MTTDHTSAVERLPGEFRKCGCPHCDYSADQLEAAIKQDSEAGAVGYIWPGSLGHLGAGNRMVKTTLWDRPTGQSGTALYTRPAAALPEVDEAMAEKVLDLYVLECIETHRDDAPKAHRIEAMQNALTAALRPETQG